MKPNNHFYILQRQVWRSLNYSNLDIVLCPIIEIAMYCIMSAKICVGIQNVLERIIDRLIFINKNRNPLVPTLRYPPVLHFHSICTYPYTKAHLWSGESSQTHFAYVGSIKS